MRIIVRIGIGLAIVAAAIAGYAGWLGYWSDDPFVPVPAATPESTQPLAAVIVSGDMGFKTGMGPEIAGRLSKDGIPVLGVNSLVYFRDRRSPAEIRAFIADAIERGLRFGHARKLVLIGQSFGADMVQVGLDGLSPELKAKLAAVVLVVPGDTVDYRVSPAELLDLIAPDAAALPTARKLDWIPTTCIQGAEETDSLCPHLKAPNVHKVALPGGHPLHRNADALYVEIVKAIERAELAH